jgi:hypothetical protein
MHIRGMYIEALLDYNKVHEDVLRTIIQAP